MTKQEVFEKAVRGIAGQNWEKSVNDEGDCVYRSQNDLTWPEGV